MLCFCFPLLFCPISILLHPPPNITPILHLSPHRALLRPHGTQTRTRFFSARNAFILQFSCFPPNALHFNPMHPLILSHHTHALQSAPSPPRFPSITGYFTRHFSEYVDEELYNQSTALTRTQGPRPAEGTPPGTLV